MISRPHRANAALHDAENSLGAQAGAARAEVRHAGRYPQPSEWYFRSLNAETGDALHLERIGAQGSAGGVAIASLARRNLNPSTWDDGMDITFSRVYTVSTLSRVWINRVWLPMPYSWSAEQGKCFFPCLRSRLRICFRETGSAVQSRVSPLVLHTHAESGAYQRDFSRFPRWRPPITAIRQIPSLSGHALAYQWRSLLRGHRYTANPQGNSSNGCCLSFSSATVIGT